MRRFQSRSQLGRATAWCSGFSSRFSRSNSFRRCRSSVVSPARWPGHARPGGPLAQGLAVQPNLLAIEPIAAHWDGYSGPCSCTRRIARSRTSGGIPTRSCHGRILSRNSPSQKAGTVQFAQSAGSLGDSMKLASPFRLNARGTRKPLPLACPTAGFRSAIGPARQSHRFKDLHRRSAVRDVPGLKAPMSSDLWFYPQNPVWTSPNGVELESAPAHGHLRSLLREC